MNGDKNKPIDSSQLHKGNDLEIPVKHTSVSTADEHKAESSSDANAININVKSSRSDKEAQPISLESDSIETVHIEDSKATPVQDNNIDIAEELKIEEPIEPKAADDIKKESEPNLPSDNELKPTESEAKSSKEDGTSSASAVNTPGVLVLQWLTYAFWGWTCLIMIWLTYVVSAYFVADQTEAYSISAYMLAAVLVLLPLSLVCDWLYSRKEPHKKTGASMVLMIVHAVIFAMLAIGALIAFMYALVQYMLVPPSDLTDVYILMTSSIVVTIMYSSVFLRTLNPLPKKKLGLVLSIFMLIFIATLAVVNVLGPISTQRSIQQDNETNKHLDALVEDINNHAISKGSLPDNLSSSTFSGKDNALVVSNSVEYTKYGTDVEVARVLSGDDLVEFKDYIEPESLKLSFQICVNYKVDTSHDDVSPLTLSMSSEHFYAPSNHESGKTCYDLYAIASSSH